MARKKKLRKTASSLPQPKPTSSDSEDTNAQPTDNLTRTTTKTTEQPQYANTSEATGNTTETHSETESDGVPKVKNFNCLKRICSKIRSLTPCRRRKDYQSVNMPDSDTEPEDLLKNRRSSLARLETFFAKLIRRVVESKIPLNEILTYVLVGYILGLIITILWYNFITNHEINTPRWIFWTVAMISGILLAHSTAVRCTVTLAIPILSSSRGRSLIIALAFFLAVIGPTANTFKNIGVMSSSLACGQMQLKQALSDMLDTLKKPLVAIKEAIQTAIRELKKVLKNVQKVLQRIQTLIMTLLVAIKKAFAWLRDIVSICNKEFGTPFERCIKIADSAMKDCRELLGSLADLCEVTNVFRWLCYTAKIVDVICVLVDFISDSVIGLVMRKLQAFTDEVKKMFDVSITFDHDFYFKTTSSKELDQVRKDIMADIKHRMHTFLLIFGWLDILGFVCLGFVLVKAIYFRMKYLRNPSYHNNFITTDFVEIDERRRLHGQETALPLQYQESWKYPRLSDYRLTPMEWLHMARSAVFLNVSTVQLFCICFTDYCLFWVLALISFYGLRQKGFEPPPYITVHITGSGFVGEIFRGIVGAFEPLSQNYTTDTKTCLPIPYEPNFRYYYYILCLCLVAWLFLICEPYSLRLRHIVMRLYYPDVAKERAVWLYDKILLNRLTFMKLARRKARLLFIRDHKTDDFSFMDWIKAKAENHFLGRLICGRSKSEKCILCGIPLKSHNRVKCDTIGCKALYCKTCYKESRNICCICNNPLAYGDFSDMSDVQDSSDDPNVVHIDECEEFCPVKVPEQKKHKKKVTFKASCAKNRFLTCFRMCTRLFQRIFKYFRKS